MMTKTIFKQFLTQYNESQQQQRESGIRSKYLDSKGRYIPAYLRRDLLSKTTKDDNKQTTTTDNK